MLSNPMLNKKQKTKKGGGGELGFISSAVYRTVWLQLNNVPWLMSNGYGSLVKHAFTFAGTVYCKQHTTMTREKKNERNIF